MSRRADDDFLKDIGEAIRRIKAYTDAMTYDRFLEDLKTQDAVVRNLEIIGEATKSLSMGLREKYSEVPWRGMAGVRDRLIHHYFGINLDVVWSIVTSELPTLESQIDAIMQEEQGDD
jgi:uncharacterized protein with HEPN domain